MSFKVFQVQLVKDNWRENNNTVLDILVALIYVTYSL